LIEKAINKSDKVISSRIIDDPIYKEGEIVKSKLLMAKIKYKGVGKLIAKDRAD